MIQTTDPNMDFTFGAHIPLGRIGHTQFINVTYLRADMSDVRTQLAFDETDLTCDRFVTY